MCTQSHYGLRITYAPASVYFKVGGGWSVGEGWGFNAYHFPVIVKEEEKMLCLTIARRQRNLFVC